MQNITLPHFTHAMLCQTRLNPCISLPFITLAQHFITYALLYQAIQDRCCTLQYVTVALLNFTWPVHDQTKPLLLFTSLCNYRAIPNLAYASPSRTELCFNKTKQCATLPKLDWTVPMPHLALRNQTPPKPYGTLLSHCVTLPDITHAVRYKTDALPN